MREIDRRTGFSRRGFIRTAAAAPAAIAAGASISASAAWAADAKSIAPHAMATLVRAARDIYPHDHIADRLLHHCAITPWDAKAAARTKRTRGTDCRGRYRPPECQDAQRCGFGSALRRTWHGKPTG